MMISRRCTIATLSPIILSFTLILPMKIRANESGIDIGVLEESATSNDANNELRSGVRILFKKADLGWQVICDSKSANSKEGCKYASAEKATDWFVQNNGKPLATLQTQDWFDTQSASDLGLLKIANGLVPIVGEKSDAYSGWAKVPVHRPLVVSSIPLTNSSQTWQEVTTNKHSVKLVWPSFHKFISKLEICVLGRQGKQSKTKLRETTMKDLDIDYIWESTKKNHLIHIRIKPDIIKNCGASDTANTQLWLYQPRAGKLHKLPDLPGDVIYPVDFGDFGGDGHEAALFQINGDGVAGYALYFNDFKDQVRYTWNDR